MTERRSATHWVCLQEEPLSIEPLMAFVADERAGAIDVFVGVTRRFTRGAETTVLTYDAYPEMALSEMEALITEAAADWDIVRTALHHRTGRVDVGEASVVIVVSAAHRRACLGAVGQLIDRLKDRVPIWKREHYADGSTEWVEGDPSKP